MGDEADRADQEIDYYLQTAINKTKIVPQKQCKNGDTIICCNCDEDIPLERLKLVPQTHLCVNCANVESIKNKVYRNL